MLVSPCRLRAPGVNDDDPAAALYDRVQSFLEPGLADQRPLGDQRISADQDGERGPPQIRPRQERDIIVEEMAGHKAGRGVFRIYIYRKRVGEGKSVSVRLESGGRWCIKQKKTNRT